VITFLDPSERPILSLWIGDDVTALRPDVTVRVVVALGVGNGPSDAASVAELEQAQRAVVTSGLAADPASHPHLAAWRETFQAFGAKPRRTPNSAEALIRRAGRGGVPPISVLVDLYNAVSLRHAIPVGGEDIQTVRGTSRLVRAQGDERFDTTANGEPVIESPEPGEVVWRDDVGVTCRRWNWRQGTRTWLTETTRDAYFLLEALAPAVGDPLEAATEDLVTLLRRWSPDTVIATATLSADTPEETITVGATASVSE